MLIITIVKSCLFCSALIGSLFWYEKTQMSSETEGIDRVGVAVLWTMFYATHLIF